MREMLSRQLPVLPGECGGEAASDELLNSSTNSSTFDSSIPFASAASSSSSSTSSAGSSGGDGEAPRRGDVAGVGAIEPLALARVSSRSDPTAARGGVAGGEDAWGVLLMGEPALLGLRE